MITEYGADTVAGTILLFFELNPSPTTSPPLSPNVQNAFFRNVFVRCQGVTSSLRGLGKIYNPLQPFSHKVFFIVF